MRFMCDSTNINDDPTSFALVAYYCDGAFAVSEAAVRARFPHAVLVPISAIGTNNGVVGDCEPGCMTEDELVTWVVERRAAGVDPTGYVNEMHGWIPARAAFARRGVREPHWWVADYDGLDVIPAGAVAKQDKNSAMTGGHFDKSVVVDYWPGVDSAYGASAAGHTEGASDMPTILSPGSVQPGSGEPLYLVFEEGGRTVKRHLSEAEWGAYSAAGATAHTFAGVASFPDASGFDAAAAYADLKGRIELIEQSPAIAAEHSTPPGP